MYESRDETLSTSLETNMNHIRLVSSGSFFLFSLYCAFFDPDLPFSLPDMMYLMAFFYFAFFPIKDMLACCNPTLYKGRQFASHYLSEPNLDQKEFQAMIKTYDHRAFHAMLFWLIFLLVPGSLYLLGVLDRIWMFVLFALSNFSVFFAIYGWCPFHAIFIRASCCMECRIYNWDCFFQYSFLIFFPHPLTYLLCFLGLCSLLLWEIHIHRYPQRFYKMSNRALSCQACDLDGCRQHKKKLFSKTLLDQYREDHS